MASIITLVDGYRLLKSAGMERHGQSHFGVPTKGFSQVEIHKVHSAGEYPRHCAGRDAKNVPMVRVKESCPEFH